MQILSRCSIDPRRSLIDCVGYLLIRGNWRTMVVLVVSFQVHKGAVRKAGSSTCLGSPVNGVMRFLNSSLIHFLQFFGVVWASTRESAYDCRWLNINDWHKLKLCWFLTWPLLGWPSFEGIFYLLSAPSRFISSFISPFYVFDKLSDVRF